MNRKFLAIASMVCSTLCFFNTQNAFSTPLNYEVYLESWDPYYSATISGLPAGPSGGQSYAGVVVDIAFAELVSTTPGLFTGLGFQDSSIAPVDSIISTVHNNGGQVKISFGGQLNIHGNQTFWFQDTVNYPTPTTGFPNNAVALATNIATIFNGTNYTNLDGLDFDIEEKLEITNLFESDPNLEFAEYLLLFFKTLRTNIPTKTISITIPGQAWPATWKTPPVPNSYWQLICQAFFVADLPADFPIPNASQYFGLVDYVNIMEYPLQLLAGESYTFSQIVQDINYYTLPTTQIAPGINHPGWGIPASKIQLGLCVASASPGQTMIPSSMQTLAQAVNSPSVAYPNGFGSQLYGVMIWDISLDAQPTRPNPQVSPLPEPYAYSQAVRLGLTETLPPASTTEQNRRNQSARAGIPVTSTRYGEPEYITPTAYPN